MPGNNTEDLKWLDIDDFTPGIHQIYSSKMPPGAARDTTQGCIAGTRSGLTGLPIEDFDWHPTQSIGSGSATWQIAGILIIPATKSTDPTEIAYGAGLSINASASADDSVTAHHSVGCYIAFERVTSTPTRRNVLLLGAFIVNPAAPPTSEINDSEESLPVVDTDIAHTYLSYTRSIGDKNGAFARSITEVGTPVVVACAVSLWSPSEIAVGNDANYLIMTPDPTDLPNIGGPTILDFGSPSAITPSPPMAEGRMLIHQNRILTARYRFYGPYGNTFLLTQDAAPSTNDSIQWTQVNCVNKEYEQAFGDKPYGFGAWGSLTASDLLMITHGDGAILVQGDLNAPTVRKLPGVVGTAGLECEGVNTPVGFVYGVGAGGVYSWQGADGSTYLSPQMSDQFWVSATASKHRNHKGSFARWGNWVLTPNGFLMDLDTKGWWRIDGSTRPVINWQVSPNGAHAYGSPADYNPASAPTQYAVKGFNRFIRRTTWLWESHPFIATAHRRINIRELVLIVRATSTSSIRVTFKDDDATEYASTIPVTAKDITQAIRVPLAVDVYNMSVKIESLSGNSEVYGLRIGYVDRQNQPLTAV